MITVKKLIEELQKFLAKAIKSARIGLLDPSLAKRKGGTG